MDNSYINQALSVNGSVSDNIDFNIESSNNEVVLKIKADATINEDIIQNKIDEKINSTIDTLVKQIDILTNKVNSLGATNFINVKAYGAKGDGKTDDSSSIQAAIDYASSIGGGTVFIPVGTYIINTPLVCRSYVNIIGDSKYKSILKLKNNANCNILNISTGRGCTISDFTINGNKMNNQSSTYYGISIVMDKEDFDLLILNNLVIEAINGTGIYAGYGWIYRVQNCSISDCTEYGIRIHGSDNQFTNLNVAGCGKYGISVEQGNNLFANIKSLFNGTKGNNDSGGFYIAGYRNTFSNIECQENYTNGFVMRYANNCLISGLLCDCNGIQSNELGINKDSIGLKLDQGCKYNIINVICSNFRWENYPEMQHTGIQINYADCTDNILNAKVSHCVVDYDIQNYNNIVNGFFLYDNVLLEAKYGKYGSLTNLATNSTSPKLTDFNYTVNNVASIQDNGLLFTFDGTQATCRFDQKSTLNLSDHKFIIISLDGKSIKADTDVSIIIWGNNKVIASFNHKIKVSDTFINYVGGCNQYENNALVDSCYPFNNKNGSTSGQYSAILYVEGNNEKKSVQIKNIIIYAIDADLAKLPVSMYKTLLDYNIPDASNNNDIVLGTIAKKL